MIHQWWSEPTAGEIVWCHFPDDIHPRPKPRPALILTVFDDDAPRFTVRVAYGTSKAALIHLTKQQAVELAGLGIRCNAIAPGPVETAMAQQVHTAEIRADYHAAVPLARYGSEEEIANGIGFLCSPEASYVTGQVLAVDGGFDAAGVGLPTLRRDFGGV